MDTPPYTPLTFFAAVRLTHGKYNKRRVPIILIVPNKYNKFHWLTSLDPL